MRTISICTKMLCRNKKKNNRGKRRNLKNCRKNEENGIKLEFRLNFYDVINIIKLFKLLTFKN